MFNISIIISRKRFVPSKECNLPDYLKRSRINELSFCNTFQVDKTKQDIKEIKQLFEFEKIDKYSNYIGINVLILFGIFIMQRYFGTKAPIEIIGCIYGAVSLITALVSMLRSFLSPL